VNHQPQMDFPGFLNVFEMLFCAADAHHCLSASNSSSLTTLTRTITKTKQLESRGRRERESVQQVCAVETRLMETEWMRICNWNGPGTLRGERARAREGAGARHVWRAWTANRVWRSTPAVDSTGTGSSVPPQHTRTSASCVCVQGRSR